MNIYVRGQLIWKLDVNGTNFWGSSPHNSEIATLTITNVHFTGLAETEDAENRTI